MMICFYFRLIECLSELGLISLYLLGSWPWEISYFSKPKRCFQYMLTKCMCVYSVGKWMQFYFLFILTSSLKMRWKTKQYYQWFKIIPQPVKSYFAPVFYCWSQRFVLATHTVRIVLVVYFISYALLIAHFTG